MKHAFVFLVCAMLLAACSDGTPARTTAGAQDQPANAPVPPTSASDYTANQLDQVLAGSWRSPEHRARDQYRHPEQTLAFFGLRPDQTVIEITPGGGWYSELLAPLLHDDGQYIAAVKAPAADTEASADNTGLRAKFAADPARYGKVTILTFDPAAPVFGPPGAADRVLTFRNVHNWAQAGNAEAMFKAFFAALRPGGVLGVVDHRASPHADLASVVDSGYLPTDYVVKLATDAGFVLDGSSEINANPKDNHDHPKGVWTLPPTLAMGDKDKARWLDIGESDRMTLRFVKPVRPTAAASVAAAR